MNQNLFGAAVLLALICIALFIAYKTIVPQKVPTHTSRCQAGPSVLGGYRTIQHYGVTKESRRAAKNQKEVCRILAWIAGIAGAVCLVLAPFVK